MIAVAFFRTWHAMWWEWHVLVAVAFGAIVLAARVEYRIDRRDAERLAEVVDTIRSGGPVDEVLARFRNEGMSCRPRRSPARS